MALIISAKMETEIGAIYIIKMGKIIMRVDVIFTDNDVVMILTKPIDWKSCPKYNIEWIIFKIWGSGWLNELGSWIT